MSTFTSSPWQETFPYTRGTGTADAIVVDGYVQLGFSIKRGVMDPDTGVEVPLLVSNSICCCVLLGLATVGSTFTP